ncbi:MAG: hypothetical protein ABF296_05230 [Oceanococcaceae bacterium]
MMRLALPLALASATLLMACADNNDNLAGMPTPAPTVAPTVAPTMTPTPTPTMAPLSSTEQVRAIASQTSEVDEPIVINDGAFVFNDTSETNAPAPVNR